MEQIILIEIKSIGFWNDFIRGRIDTSLYIIVKCQNDPKNKLIMIGYLKVEDCSFLKITFLRAVNTFLCMEATL